MSDYGTQLGMYAKLLTFAESDLPYDYNPDNDGPIHWTSGADLAQWRYFYQEDVGYVPTVSAILHSALNDFDDAPDSWALLASEF